MTPVRRLPTTQSGQTSKYTTLVSDCASVSELLQMNCSQFPDAGQYLAVAAKFDLCTNHCEMEPTICWVFILRLAKENSQAIAGLRVKHLFSSLLRVVEKVNTMNSNISDSAGFTCTYTEGVICGKIIKGHIL